MGSDGMEPALLEALRESTDDLAEEWRRAAGTGWHESGPSGSGLLGNAARFLRALWAHLGDPSDGESLALVAGGDQGEVPAALQCLKSVLRERVISCCPSQVESATAALRAIEAAIDRHISVSLYRGGEESAWAWDRGVHEPVGQAGIAAAPRAADASAQGEAVGVSEVAGQMRELRAVRELAALAVSGKSTQEIIEASVDIIARALEADFVRVFLYDENSGVLRLAGDKDLPEAVRRRISKQEVRPGAPGIAGRTALTRKPVIVEDLLTDPLAEHARKEVQETGARSMLSAPAIGNEGLVGVFQVVTRRRRSFTDEEVGLLRTMGHQLALVIERSRADEESRRRTRELECLNVIGRAAAEPIELEEVLESALRAGLPALGGDGGVVYLLDRDAGILRRAAVVGTLGHKVMPAMAQVTPGEGLTGRVVVTGVGEAVNDTIEDGDLVLPGTAQLGVMAVASAPLRGREGIVGALTIGATRKNAFSSDAVHLLEAIGAQLGVAVENARLYREAMAAERYAKNILAATPHPILVADCDLCVTEFNDAVASMFGLRRPEHLGMRLSDLWPPERRAEVAKLAESVLRGDAVEEFETEIVGGDGARIPCRVALSALRDERGQIEGCVAITTDLRKQRELEEQLVKAERLHALGEMASGVAHDFNNVLAGILGRTQLLIRRADDDKFLKELRTIEQIALDGAETVRRIQEFTHLQRPRQYVRVSPQALVRDALAMTRHRWADKRSPGDVQIRIETDLADTPAVAGSPAELREVLVNLILNAVDALVEGGTIRLSTWSDDEWVYIAVSDDGIGMTRETALRVLEPFFTTKGVAGTGLGLSVSYGIVLRHGGDIAVESAPGEGATFTVTLPPASAAGAALDAEEEASEVGGARILVIDDEPLVREAISDMLDVLGHEVRTAAGGEEGIVAFSKGRYDMVITDLGMPDISGWEVAAAIKERNPDAFVALLTGWGTQMDPDRLADGAVDMLLGKPVTAAQLEKAVEKALTSRNAAWNAGGEGDDEKPSEE